MSESNSINWITLPDVAERTGLPLGRLRRLVEDRALLTTRIDGVQKVPSSFVVDGEILPSLRGTIMLLLDCGLSDDEAMDWLITPEYSLDAAPIDALVAGRKAEVRRVASLLAL